MIVRCPECSTRYAIDDKALLPQGRSVKCASCAHVWHQMPDIQENSDAPKEVFILKDFAVTPRLHEGRRPGWVRWIFGGAVIVAIFIAFIMTRNTVASFCPEAEKLYAMIGLPVELPGAGLTLSNTASQEQVENGVLMYTVTGDIINTSDRMKEIPTLKVKVIGTPEKGKCIEMLNDNQCVLDRWEHHLAKSHLLPGEQVHFETAPRPRTDSALSVTVEF